MINILLGAPGGGKSYEAVVYHVLPALRRGRKVITNLPLHVEAFEAIEPGSSSLIELRTATLADQNFKLVSTGRFGTISRLVDKRPFANPEDFASDWRDSSGNGPLYIVDECHFVMPKGKTRVQVEEWFSMHRHFNCDVLLITQSAGKISEPIRDLIQTCYRVRKAIAFGKPESYIRRVLDGVGGAEISSGIRDYKPQFFPLYRSHTHGTAVAEVDAEDVSPRIVKFKRLTWIVLGAGVVSSLYVGSLFFRDKPALVPTPRQLVRVSPGASGSSSAVTASPVPVSALPPVVQVENLNPEPFGTNQIHLTGSATMGKRTIYQFSVSQNGTPVMQVFDYELVKAGYKWVPSLPCAGTLVWGDKARAVICDAPRITMGGSNGGSVATVNTSSPSQSTSIPPLPSSSPGV